MIVEKPVRKQFSYTQLLKKKPDEIFGLLCPVRECEWVPNWSPVAVFSESGVMEKHCIFLTDDGEQSAVWLVTKHDPEQYALELFKVTPEHTVGRIEIRLSETTEQFTAAEVTYEYSAIGPEGEKFLEGFTGEWYRTFMQRWERALNHYLEHGRKLDV